MKLKKTYKSKDTHVEVPDAIHVINYIAVNNGVLQYEIKSFANSEAKNPFNVETPKILPADLTAQEKAAIKNLENVINTRIKAREDFQDAEDYQDPEPEPEQ